MRATKTKGDVEHSCWRLFAGGSTLSRSQRTSLPRNHLKRRHPSDRAPDACALRAGQHLGSGQPASIGRAPERNRHLPFVDARATGVAVAEPYRADHMTGRINRQHSGRRWRDGHPSTEDARAGRDHTVRSDIERTRKAVVLGGPMERRSVAEHRLPCPNDHGWAAGGKLGPLIGD
jgi:hypothetical protein